MLNNVFSNKHYRGLRGCDRILIGFPTTYRCNQCQSPLKVVSSNPARVELYSIQHYVIICQYKANPNPINNLMLQLLLMHH